jgi:hypothetical protein
MRHSPPPHARPHARMHAFMQSTTGDFTVETSVSLEAYPGLRQLLDSGFAFINILSNANPGGEVRGALEEARALKQGGNRMYHKCDIHCQKPRCSITCECGGRCKTVCKPAECHIKCPRPPGGGDSERKVFCEKPKCQMQCEELACTLLEELDCW